MVTIWPAWKSCWISSYVIQFCLTHLYWSHLFYKPASTRSARKELHLHHQQLWSSMLYYQMTCSIPTNTLDCLRQHHKWLASFLLPIVLGCGWAWSSFCSIFTLFDNIYHWLDDNKYTGTQAFAHMEFVHNYVLSMYISHLQTLMSWVRLMSCVWRWSWKKNFFKLTVQTHDLRHMTKAMLATAQHNNLTICPLTISNIILNIACHGSASRQHKIIFPSKWYLHPN